MKIRVERLHGATLTFMVNEVLRGFKEDSLVGEFHSDVAAAVRVLDHFRVEVMRADSREMCARVGYNKPYVRGEGHVVAGLRAVISLKHGPLLDLPPDHPVVALLKAGGEL